MDGSPSRLPCSRQPFERLYSPQAGTDRGNAAIRPYDEQKWAGLADSLTFDPQLAIELLEPLHNRWAPLFEALTDADYEKAYLHPDTGEEISLHHALALYVWHSKHHTAHITSLRE